MLKFQPKTKASIHRYFLRQAIRPLGECAHLYVSVHVCVYRSVCARTCLCVRTSVSLYVHGCVCKHMSLCLCVCLCVCVCMCVCAYVCEFLQLYACVGMFACARYHGHHYHHFTDVSTYIKSGQLLFYQLHHGKMGMNWFFQLLHVFKIIYLSFKFPTQDWIDFTYL